MITDPKKILIIGGPDKDKCYSEKGITRVAYDPLDVLRLGPLYDYDIVIVWPNTCSDNNIEMNVTKGDLLNAIPRHYFTRYYQYAINKSAKQNIIKKFYTRFLRTDRFDAYVIGRLLYGFLSRRYYFRYLHYLLLFHQHSTNQREKKNVIQRVVAWFNNEMYSYIWQDGEHCDNHDIDPDNLFSDADKLEMIGDNDKRNVYAWFRDKLREIILGVVNARLAFFIVPTDRCCDQTPDSLKQIPFQITLEYAPENNVHFNQLSEINSPIENIMKELGLLVTEWTYRMAIAPSRGHPDRLLLGFSNPSQLLGLKIKGYKSGAFHRYPWSAERKEDYPNDGCTPISIRDGHLDGRGIARSLMMLTEKGGLAVIPKPKSIDDFVGLIQKSLSPPTLNEIPEESTKYSIEECRAAKIEIEKLISPQTNPMIGDSNALLKIYPDILRAAQNPGHILIYGETGTGKKMVYNLIQMLNPGKPFESIDLAGIADDKLHSMLFGHIKGAYTGANEMREGIVSNVKGGALVLDNIHNASSTMFDKILRLLEPEQNYIKLGDNKIQQADCRVVAGTNIPPEQMIKNGMIKHEFLNRFMFTIRIPSLDERKEDVKLLVEHFIEKWVTINNPEDKRFLPDLLSLADTWLKDLVVRTWKDKNIRGLETEVYQYCIDQTADLEKEPSRRRGRKEDPDKEHKGEELAEVIAICVKKEKSNLDDLYDAIKERIPGLVFTPSQEKESKSLEMHIRRKLDHDPDKRDAVLSQLKVIEERSKL